MARRINISGQRFGRWTVLTRIPAKYAKGRGGRWNARCDCGKQKVVHGSHLKDGVSRSCGCLNIERTSKPEGVAARNQTRDHYKLHAKNRGLSWNISDEQFLGLTQLPCHYCGVFPSNKTTTPRGVFVYSGIDRKDSNIGYEIDNVLPCCKICNHNKSNKSYEDFVAWIKRAAIHLRLL